MACAFCGAPCLDCGEVERLSSLELNESLLRLAKHLSCHSDGHSATLAKSLDADEVLEPTRFCSPDDLRGLAAHISLRGEE